MKESLSVVMPVYNDVTHICKNIERVRETLTKLGYRFEIVVVDDGSTDGTSTAVNWMPGIKKVIKYQNEGKGAAIIDGFKSSDESFDYVLLLDSDLQVNVADIKLLFNHMEFFNADCVIGNKRHSYSYMNYSFARQFVSRTYNFLCRKIFNISFTDTQCGFKLYKKYAVSRVRYILGVKRFAFDVELLLALRVNGFRVVDAPVNMKPQYNVGSVSIKNIIRTFMDTLRVWTRYRKGYYRLI